jgi:hypothetical protein
MCHTTQGYDGGYHFKVRTKWHKKAVNFRYWMKDGWNKEEVTSGGHPCRCVSDANPCLDINEKPNETISFSSNSRNEWR